MRNVKVSPNIKIEYDTESIPNDPFDLKQKLYAYDYDEDLDEKSNRREVSYSKVEYEEDFQDSISVKGKQRVCYLSKIFKDADGKELYRTPANDVKLLDVQYDSKTKKIKVFEAYRLCDKNGILLDDVVYRKEIKFDTPLTFLSDEGMETEIKLPDNPEYKGIFFKTALGIGYIHNGKQITINLKGDVSVNGTLKYKRLSNSKSNSTTVSTSDSVRIHGFDPSPKRNSNLKTEYIRESVPGDPFNLNEKLIAVEYDPTTKQEVNRREVSYTPDYKMDYKNITEGRKVTKTPYIIKRFLDSNGNELYSVDANAVKLLDYKCEKVDGKYQIDLKENFRLSAKDQNNKTIFLLEDPIHTERVKYHYERHTDDFGKLMDATIKLPDCPEYQDCFLHNGRERNSFLSSDSFSLSYNDNGKRVSIYNKDHKRFPNSISIGGQEYRKIPNPAKPLNNNAETLQRQSRVKSNNSYGIFKGFLGVGAALCAIIIGIGLAGGGGVVAVIAAGVVILGVFAVAGLAINCCCTGVKSIFSSSSKTSPSVEAVRSNEETPVTVQGGTVTEYKNGQLHRTYGNAPSVNTNKPDEFTGHRDFPGKTFYFNEHGNAVLDFQKLSGAELEFLQARITSEEAQSQSSQKRWEAMKELVRMNQGKGGAQLAKITDL